MDYKNYPAMSQVARGMGKADLVLKNGNVLNVFTEEFHEADIAICGGTIVGVGSYSGNREIDMRGKYVVPGFVDSHLHLESTLVQPFELINEALKYGTTTFVVDPHESANVAGLDGIDYILDQTSDVAANVFVMVPSCVPAAPFEDNGYILNPGEMKKYLENERILGLGEVMDCPAVITGDSVMMEKLDMFQPKILDGHAPFLNDGDLAAYALAGIKTDHECCDYEYAKKEIGNGIYVLIREGSAAKNLEAIVKGIVSEHASTERYCFCTDDKHIEEIKKDGHISFNVKKAVSLGIPPQKALKMASWQATVCYGMKNLGAIAPGYQADVVVLDDLENIRVADVFHKGMNIKEYSAKGRIPCPENIKHTVQVKDFNRKKLEIETGEKEFPVIEIIPGQIVTKKVFEKLPAKDGIFISDNIYSKIAVVERHKGTGKVGVGVLKGFGIRNGAIASSVSHDSHNIIVVGDNDDDMVAAVNELIEKQGGYTIISGGKSAGTLPLPVMGLMSDAGHEEVEEKLKTMISKAWEMGVNPKIDTFINLSFMALPVIPEIRITARGIYDVAENVFYGKDGQAK
ncbi:adenine deaminase [Anaerobium acetethylicum]|uniref:Adenine deaminase n=1 Tax=Anaerobium acetethylicum TaxID=1619234 RepID=A0A1D3TTE4_9FIRM|nr:adenine deaminase [Anaerobium acetethylicum]SCP97260.1 adenine deaminase [Anaerobium acetethylicum]